MPTNGFQTVPFRFRAGAGWLIGCVLFMLISAGSNGQTPSARSGDAEAGHSKAALCAACHGPAGVSVNPLWPSLAGQQTQYLAKQIRLFRDGERKEITMQPFVQNLTDQDIEDLAAYYASLSPCP